MNYILHWTRPRSFLADRCLSSLNSDEVGRLRAQESMLSFSEMRFHRFRAAKENTLVSGRKQLELIGRPVRGDEEIGAVFAGNTKTKYPPCLKEAVFAIVFLIECSRSLLRRFFSLVWRSDCSSFGLERSFGGYHYTFRSLTGSIRTDRTVTQEQLED